MCFANVPKSWSLSTGSLDGTLTSSLLLFLLLLLLAIRAPDVVDLLAVDVLPIVAL